MREAGSDAALGDNRHSCGSPMGTVEWKVRLRHEIPRGSSRGRHPRVTRTSRSYRRGAAPAVAATSRPHPTCLGSPSATARVKGFRLLRSMGPASPHASSAWGSGTYSRRHSWTSPPGGVVEDLLSSPVGETLSSLNVQQSPIPCGRVAPRCVQPTQVVGTRQGLEAAVGPTPRAFDADGAPVTAIACHLRPLCLGFRTSSNDRVYDPKWRRWCRIPSVWSRTECAVLQPFGVQSPITPRDGT
jgi:hypothetical protein